MKISTINRFFNILLGALAMVAVAIFSAYLAMRIAIHGREVEVPTLTNLSLSDASKKATALGLRLNVENRFYSATVPPGTVIGQSPIPGTTVRRQFAVRITESLGAQQVSIPNLIGQPERPATITLRRLALELGVVAHIPSPGPPGIVLAQTPTSSATGVDSPRVSILISDPEPVTTPEPKPAADPATNRSPEAAASSAPAANPAASPSATTNTDAAPGFPMPTLTGLTLTTAVSRATNAGLHVVSAEEQNPVAAVAKPATPPATPAATPTAAIVVDQTPPAGQQVKKGDPVKITLEH